jgi:hypothetical protein
VAPAVASTVPSTAPAATAAPRTSVVRTGWYVVRSGGFPVPGWVTATTPTPAITPAKVTVPPRAARTGVPTGAARSTPR